MKRSISLVAGVLFGIGAVALSGCSSKPSCKLLYDRYKKCDEKRIKNLKEDDFLALCKKIKDKDRVADEIACSKESDCDKFKECLKKAKKKARAGRVKKRWKEAQDKMKEGKYSAAMTFCEIWKDDLTPEIKKECESLPAKAVDELMKEIKAKRDKGEVSYKQVKCWDLKRYAKKAGDKKKKEAETLCKEVEITRDLKKAKEAVEKQLKKDRPYLPYYCSKRKIEKIEKVGTPYAKKLKSDMIDLCYKKLGKVILEKKLPNQKYSCLVRNVYKGIKEHGVKGPEIDKLMEKAAGKCEKK